MVFTSRQMQEKFIEQNKNLFVMFIDLTKAFDSINRKALWMVLEKFGCPKKFTKIINEFHNGMTGRVVIEGGTTDQFPITTGVKHRCVLAPTLFGLYFAAMLSEVDLSDGIYHSILVGRQHF